MFKVRARIVKKRTKKPARTFKEVNLFKLHVPVKRILPFFWLEAFVSFAGQKETKLMNMRKVILLTLSAFLITPSPLFPEEPKDIFRQTISAVVLVVTNVQPDGKASSLGSGFIVDPKGIVLTNRHVLTGARQVSVKLIDGTSYSVNGIYLDANRDICLLKIDAQKLPALPLADSDSIAVGEKVYTIGNPLGLSFTFSDGMLSGKRNFKEIKYLQFTAPISPGNSGGPLLNSIGQAVGIVTATTSGENLNFALAINEVKPFVAAIPSLKFEPMVSGKAEEILSKKNTAFSSQENDDQAIADLTKAIERKYNLVESYNNRGILYVRKGNYDQAIPDFTKTIALKPDLVDAYCNRAAAYIQMGKYKEAIQDCSKAIQLNPKLADAYHNRAIAYIQQKDYTDAIQDCSKAIALDPTLADAYNNRGVAYYHKGAYKKAWADIHTAEQMGYKVNAQFLESLKKASGREK